MTMSEAGLLQNSRKYTCFSVSTFVACWTLTWAPWENSCCSVVSGALCDPMDCSTPCFPVIHCFLEFAQIHVHWFSGAIQPSHPLLPSFPFALNLYQHQGIFHWVGSSHWVVKVLKLQVQHHSFQWIFGVDVLWNWLVWSPCYPRDSQESSPAPVWKNQFFGALPISYLFYIR